MATINGTSGNDTIDEIANGGSASGNDEIFGLGGNDLIRMYQNSDGDGSPDFFVDTVHGGGGSDTLKFSILNGFTFSATDDPSGGYTGGFTENIGQDSWTINFDGIERFDVDMQAGGTLTLPGGDDIVRATFNATVNSGAGNDDLTTTGGGNSFNAGDGNDIARFAIDSTANTGNLGNGNDRLVVDYTNAQSTVYMLTALSGSLAAGYSGDFYISGGYSRTYFSGVENFTLTTGQYDDTVAVRDGNDIVATGLGSDALTSGGGNDTLDGGGGVDALSISLADETQGVAINLVAAGQQQSGGLGSIVNFESFTGTVTGSAFGDTLTEGRYDYNTTFNMGGGADTVKVSDGTDTINGEAGNDRLVVDYSTAESYVYMITPLTTDPAGGYQGAFYISGGYARANFTGIENFTVTGGDYNDFLDTGDGNDTITSGTGDDTLTVGKGNDAVNGGAGVDALSINLADENAGVAINLLAAGAQQTGGTGSIVGVESFQGTVTGSAFGDTLAEGRYNFDATFNMGAGNDTVTVSDGTDTINGEAGTDRLTVDYSTAESSVYMITPLTADPVGGYQGAFYISGGYARANFTGIENFTVTGGIFDDTLVTGDGNDVVASGDGADVLTIGQGNDAVNGGAGVDALSISLTNENAGVSINLLAAGAQQTGGTGSIVGVESFQGTVTGSAFGDTLAEGRYNFDATFNMGAGNDTVSVSDGTDTINGEAGTDRLVVDYSTAESVVYLITPISGTLATGYSGAYYVSGGYARANFSGIESFTVTGGIYNDTLTTGDGADVLLGGAGNDAITAAGGKDLVSGGLGDDTMDGGAGVDTASYADATAKVTVSLAVTTAQATGGAGNDTLTGFENLTGSAFGDTLTGSAAANTIDAGAGQDKLKGGSGNDILDGGLGADRLDGGKGGDLLTGGTGDDQHTGGAGGDTFFFTDGAGSDDVLDFSRAQGDLIRIDAAGVDDFGDLVIVSDGSGGSTVAFGSVTIDVAGVAPSALAAQDFVFGPPGAAPIAQPPSDKAFSDDAPVTSDAMLFHAVIDPQPMAMYLV